MVAMRRHAWTLRQAYEYVKLQRNVGEVVNDTGFRSALVECESIFTTHTTMEGVWTKAKTRAGTRALAEGENRTCHAALPPY
jgi:hypothetical protein